MNYFRPLLYHFLISVKELKCSPAKEKKKNLAVFETTTPHGYFFFLNTHMFKDGQWEGWS